MQITIKPKEEVWHPTHCRMTIQDINIKVASGSCLLSGQIAALFNNEQALSAADDLVTVQLSDPDVLLYASKFVLQLRSSVFRAELNSAFSEGVTRELRLCGFPDRVASCFMELLHTDILSEDGLTAEETVALFVMGEKYDVPFVQELARNSLTTRKMTAEELNSVHAAITRFHATGLQATCAKRTRTLPERELCRLLFAGDSA